MAIFIKNDLIYRNRYCWNTEKKVQRIAVFNRHQGDEVLSLINTVMERHQLSTIKSFLKIETMLINLPFEEQTHRQVSEWIMNHWTKKVQFPKNGCLFLAT